MMQDVTLDFFWDWLLHRGGNRRWVRSLRLTDSCVRGGWHLFSATTARGSDRHMNSLSNCSCSWVVSCNDMRAIRPELFNWHWMFFPTTLPVSERWSPQGAGTGRPLGNIEAVLLTCGGRMPWWILDDWIWWLALRFDQDWFRICWADSFLSP